MNICSFIGYSEFIEKEKYFGLLYKGIENLINSFNLDTFYFCGKGKFECFCAKVLKEIKKKYFNIKCCFIMCDDNRDKVDYEFFDEIIIKNFKDKYELNQWVIDKSTFFISYSTKSYLSYGIELDFENKNKVLFVNFQDIINLNK